MDCFAHTQKSAAGVAILVKPVTRPAGLPCSPLLHSRRSRPVCRTNGKWWKQPRGRWSIRGRRNAKWSANKGQACGPSSGECLARTCNTRGASNKWEIAQKKKLRQKRSILSEGDLNVTHARGCWLPTRQTMSIRSIEQIARGRNRKKKKRDGTCRAHPATAFPAARYTSRSANIFERAPIGEQQIINYFRCP